MIKTITIQQLEALQLCTVCITDNNGGKIALSIIVSTLILLGVANWAWKKYFTNKKEISQEK